MAEIEVIQTRDINETSNKSGDKTSPDPDDKPERIKWIPREDPTQKTKKSSNSKKELQNFLNTVLDASSDEQLHLEEQGTLSNSDDKWTKFFGDALEDLRSDDIKKVPDFNTLGSSSDDILGDILSDNEDIYDDGWAQAYKSNDDSDPESDDTDVNRITTLQEYDVDDLVAHIDEQSEQIGDVKKRQKKIMKKLDQILEIINITRSNESCNKCKSS